MTKMSPEEIVKLLSSYRGEAETARNSGWGERDDQWRSNVDLYFSRFDFSGKAEWQSKNAMPEASLYIDRWAAALRAALIVPGVWYSVDTAIPELEPAFRKFLGFYLERCGTTPAGHRTDFARVFEDQAKLAALMSTAASVTWEPPSSSGLNIKSGRVRVDTVDPREVLLDPTGRGAYRVRRSEIDYYQLLALAKRNPDLWNMDEISRLGSSRSEEEETEREELVGHGVSVSSRRRTVVMDEYLAVILSDDGEDAYGSPQLCVVANNNFLIRGPEANPYYHGQDWIVFSPAISVPLSVYGKTYVETWGDIARVFVQMTNLIIDAGMMASMNAFAISADMLQNPAQAASGVFPNKTFILAPGANAKNFVETIQLGTLSTAAVSVLELLKREMREGAATNDLDLGQSVPKGDVTATEINEVKAGGTALIQSIAASLEVGCVDPILNLVFRTALQHLPTSMEEADNAHWDDLRRHLGDEYFGMFVSMGPQMAAQPPAFRARGISGLVEKGQKLRAMLQIIQALGSSPILQQAFLQSVGFGRFVRQLIILVGLDPNDFPPEPQQQALAAVGGAGGGQQVAGPRR